MSGVVLSSVVASPCLLTSEAEAAMLGYLHVRCGARHGSALLQSAEYGLCFAKSNASLLEVQAAALHTMFSAIGSSAVSCGPKSDSRVALSGQRMTLGVTLGPQ